MKKKIQHPLRAMKSAIRQVQEVLKPDEAALGAAMVLMERFEQIHKHGRTPKADADFNTSGQMRNAAIHLLNPQINERVAMQPSYWDGFIWRKMCAKSEEERLKIASALLMGEIDRIKMARKLRDKQK